ncbi:MAG: hypothetical protein AAGE52_34695 [Myxococcota bacterium]
MNRLFSAIVVAGASLGAGCYEHHRVEAFASRDTGADAARDSGAIIRFDAGFDAGVDARDVGPDACPEMCRCNPIPECVEGCDPSVFVCIL